MKLVFDQPCIEPFNRASDIRVLIACDDSAAAKQARAILEHVGRSCGADGRLICDWWTFEVLAIRSLKAFASREAAAADLVIIAAHQTCRLSRDIVDWVSGWVNRRQKPHGAMAVMLDGDVKESAVSPAVLQLKESAEAGGMDFLFGASCGNETRSWQRRTEAAENQTVGAR
jgi:hypothetical protein